MGIGSFDRRLVRLLAGEERPYVESEWDDALVVIGCGVVELEETDGTRWRFEKGAILFLTQLPLRALHNPGEEAAILMAVSRR
jgi:hypothetical protein